MPPTVVGGAMWGIAKPQPTSFVAAATAAAAAPSLLIELLGFLSAARPDSQTVACNTRFSCGCRWRRTVRCSLLAVRCSLLLFSLLFLVAFTAFLAAAVIQYAPRL